MDVLKDVKGGWLTDEVLYTEDLRFDITTRNELQSQFRYVLVTLHYGDLIFLKVNFRIVRNSDHFRELGTISIFLFKDLYFYKLPRKGTFD